MNISGLSAGSNRVAALSRRQRIFGNFGGSGRDPSLKEVESFLKGDRNARAPSSQLPSRPNLSQAKETLGTLSKDFDKIDGDQDGKLTRNEIDTYAKENDLQLQRGPGRFSRAVFSGGVSKDDLASAQAKIAAFEKNGVPTGGPNGRGLRPDGPGAAQSLAARELVSSTAESSDSSELNLVQALLAEQQKEEDDGKTIAASSDEEQTTSPFARSKIRLYSDTSSRDSIESQLKEAIAA